jgi:enamidase
MTWEGTFEPGFFVAPGGRTVIRNLRGVVTGRLGEGVLDATSLRIEGNRVTAIGDVDGDGDADAVVDANGAVAIPGLIDSHSHVVFADYSPRQHAIGWLESYMHGGVTTVMSASEVHLPGRPSDPVGVKALAITAQRAYTRFRPGGVKVLGGSLICEPGLTGTDIQEVAAAGVRLMKVGFGAFDRPADAAPLVRLARASDMVVMSHSGGASIPGSSPVTVDDLLALRPHIAGHINGGTTSLPDADLVRLIEQSDTALQLVQAGNLRSALFILRAARERGALARITLATDTPSGTGVMPLGLIKLVVEVSSLGDLPATEAIALATGTTRVVLHVEQGVLSPGCPADLVLLQEPLGGVAPGPLEAIERGDIPGIAAVLIDGQIRALKSRNTPAPSREIRVQGRIIWPS